MRATLTITLVLFLTPAVLGAAAEPAGPDAAAPAAAASLAELPHWPVGFMLPAHLAGKPGKGPVKADILVWTPPQSKRIRALLLVPNNTDSKNFHEHAALRAAAAKHEAGIVYMRNFDTDIEWERKEPPDLTRIPALLNYVAEQTGVVEFRHAPWITFGKSSRGSFPFRAAWLWPERTIASISYHGETPTWPVADFAKLKGQSILHVNANGETEWGGTWFNHVRPSLLNYRAQKGWLAHQVVAKGVGHGDYVNGNGGKGWGRPVPPGHTSVLRVWDYLALFVDKALELRVPKDKYPTDGPLELKQVDEAGGYLLDAFAVEEMFGVPHLPLKEGPTGYLNNSGDDSPVSGYLAMTPPRDFTVPEGTPVTRLEAGQSPRAWLITESLKFAMQADPMVDLGDLAKLTPKPGDQVTIDGSRVTFQPILDKHVGPKGGIALDKGLRPTNAKITLLAYTVLEVPEARCYRVQAGYTAATRVQLVLNGTPIKHKQVLQLAPGRYPLLFVLRMEANWGRVEPSLGEVSDADVALAKELQAELDKRAAEEARIKAADQPPKVLIHKAADVPKEQRGKMFWLADKELADAWVKLHTVEKRP